MDIARLSESIHASVFANARGISVVAVRTFISSIASRKTYGIRNCQAKLAESCQDRFDLWEINDTNLLPPEIVQSLREARQVRKAVDCMCSVLNSIGLSGNEFPVQAHSLGKYILDSVSQLSSTRPRASKAC